MPLASYPATMPGGFHSLIDDVPYYGEKRNAFRLPAYHRLDVDVSYYFRRGPREHRLSLSAYNAYNRLNPFVVVLERPYGGPPMPTPEMPPPNEPRQVLRGYALFPVVPSLSYSFQF